MGSQSSKKSKLISIFAGTALLALGLGVAALSSGEEPRKKKKKHRSKKQTDSEVTRSNIMKQEQEIERRQLTKMQARDIEVKKKSGFLTMDTISQILERAPVIAGSDYCELAKENRAKRRKYRKNDFAKYEKLVMAFNEQVEEILEKAQDVILRELGVQKEVFESSVVHYMESEPQNIQQFFMIQAAMRQRVKESVPAQKELTVEKTKEIIEFQIKTLQSKPPEFVQMMKKYSNDPEGAQLIPLTINTMLTDIVFDEFSVEEEDIIKLSYQNVFKDQEIQALLMQIEQAMIGLLQSAGQLTQQGFFGGM